MLKPRVYREQFAVTVKLFRLDRADEEVSTSRTELRNLMSLLGMAIFDTQHCFGQYFGWSACCGISQTIRGWLAVYCGICDLPDGSKIDSESFKICQASTTAEQ